MAEALSKFPTAKGWEDIATHARGDHEPMPEGAVHGSNHANAGTTTSNTSAARNNTGYEASSRDQQQHRLGPLVRLWGIGKDELPPLNAAPDELRSFLAAILAEASPFISSATPQSALSLPSSLWKQAKGRDKTHRDSAASVARSSRAVGERELDRLIGEKGFVLGGNSDGSGRGRNLSVPPPGDIDHGDISPGNVGLLDGNNIQPQQRQHHWNLPTQELISARRQRDRRPGTKDAGEMWFCRRSVHENAARHGTASWEEFDRFWHEEHAKSEMDMTPAVIKAHEAVRWDTARGLEIGLPGLGDGVLESWRDFRLSVYEMRHKVGRPVLKDRTFPVLLMSCRRSFGMEESAEDGAEGHDTTTRAEGTEQAGDSTEPQDGTEVVATSTPAPAVTRTSGQPDASPGEEFVLVSIPVPDFGEDKRSKLASEGGAQIAVYVSIDRVRRMPGTGQLEWVMATASDAGGVLPVWVQAAAVPEKLWKDVPMFFSWVAKQRSGG